MLRVIVGLLLLANLLFFGWSQGWLEAVGWRPGSEREPERLLRQVRPEIIRVLPPGAASAASVGAAAACLEAGPFAEAELDAVRSAAQAALPAGSVATVKTTQPGSWMVYMGRYAGRDAMTKKEDELRRRRLPYEEIRDSATLAPGLSLGRFDNPDAAARALEQFSQQGIRTARVVELAPAVGRFWLRVDGANPAIAAQAAKLHLAASGQSFAACARTTGA
ncbi:SPOR domain-containing protein [Rhizobacter fulvus]